MPLKGKYLKYKPEITIEIFKLIYQKLFENKLVDSLDYVDGEYKFFSTSFNILKLPTGANRVGCYAQNWELFKETTVQEILGYDPFEKKEYISGIDPFEEKFVLPEKWFVCPETKENLELIKKHFGKFGEYRITYKDNSYTCDGNYKPNKRDANKQGYTEITFD